MTDVETAMIRFVMIVLLGAIVGTLSFGLAIASYYIVDAVGGWVPAVVSGYAWSKWHRQCENHAELAQSLPIARVR